MHYLSADVALMVSEFLSVGGVAHVTLLLLQTCFNSKTKQVNHN